jgi:hemoglobin
VFWLRRGANLTVAPVALRFAPDSLKAAEFLGFGLRRVANCHAPSSHPRVRTSRRTDAGDGRVAARVRQPGPRPLLRSGASALCGRYNRLGLTAAGRKSNLWLKTELIWEGRLLRADLPGEGQMPEHDAPAPERPPLYDRLGGVYNIATVVDDFIDRVMTDPRLNANPRVDEAHHRVSPAGFKYLVTEMVCWATGGPQRYSGRPMGDSRRHLMITAGEWQAFLDVLSEGVVHPG